MKFSVQTIADNLDYSNFSDLYPGYSNDIEDIDRSDDYYFNSKKKFEIFANNVIDLFDSFPDEFPVYRSIKVKSEQDIDMDDLGESWSFDLESARNFGYGNGSNIMLSAIVTRDNIDWYESMHRYLIFSPGDYDDENEIVVRNTDWLKDLRISKIKEAVEVGKNPIFIREFKEFEKYNEGVADTFLQKRHNFDLDFDDFEDNYKRQSLKDDNDIVVYDKDFEDGRLVIIKNPKTLKNIGYKSRGIIDVDGNLYVLQFNVCTHMRIVKILSDLGLIQYEYNWHKEIPKDFITVQRYNSTNRFYVGESNVLYKDDEENFYRKVYSISDDFDINLYRSIFQKFLVRCRVKNPQYKFINRIISESSKNTFQNEKYLDSNYPPLYHYTPYLEKIIDDDILKKKSPYKGEDCVCLTRNPEYSYEKSDFRRLKLDQNKLRLDGYVPKSIDEFSYLWLPVNRKLNSMGHAEWEFEERIYRDIKNLGKYIISIQMPTGDDYKRGGIALNQTPLGILTYMKKYPHIKLEYYNINKRWKVTPIRVPVEIVESSK